MTEQKKWRAEVDTGEGVWHTNALRFDTRDEASEFAVGLARRWTLVQHWRTASDDTPLREPVQRDEAGFVITSEYDAL
jgi:hypothetical protein